MDLPTLTAHGRSDIGRVRTGNEDALLIGRSLFAVADGMGGHRAGEVASEAALGPLGALDGRRFTDSDAAIAALSAAFTSANAEVSRRAHEDPDLEGMGTTLTAVHIEGQEAHVVHVGDSRAYLVRPDRLVQLTTDHTLVQTLLDEGRITRDEVATHPHRSVITRAIGVSRDVEVDTVHVRLRDGDRIVLCSDGLTGVVDDDTIARTVRELAPEQAVDTLIDTANAAGGPDNITVIIVSVDGGHDPDATALLPAIVRIRTDDRAGEGPRWPGSSPFSGDMLVGAGGGRTAPRGVRPSSGRPGSGRPGSGRERLLGGTFDRVALKLLVALVTVVLLVTGIGLGARIIVDRAYLVGVSDGEVVIFRGFDVQFGPIDLKQVHERPGISLDDVQPALRPVYEAGRPAADLGDARRIVRNIPLLAPTPAEDAG